MQVVDALGQRTEISFSGWKKNPAFAKGTFSYAPAKGVDVVGRRLKQLAAAACRWPTTLSTGKPWHDG